MNKELFQKYLQWKEDYALASEPEYKESQDYDFMQAFESGYYSGISAKSKENKRIDSGKSIDDKLLQVLFSHYGLRDYTIDLGIEIQKVTLVLEVQTPFDIYGSLLVANYVPKITSIDPWFTRVEITCFTNNLTETLLDVITKLTK